MKSEIRIYQILRPLGWIYGALTGIRNLLYDRHILKSVSPDIPVINIGNITVGGTGKTPHTEYTASILKDFYRIAVLSRGYGRHTKGFFMSDNRSDSGLIGDEPMQIKRRFPDLDVAVCEDRVTGINRLVELCHPKAVILDDAYQHRKVTPSLNILLVNWHRNILNDAMLPAGRLRESARGRDRAHIIIVSKCPDGLTGQAMDDMASALRTNPSQQVYFTTLEYGNLYPLYGSDISDDIPTGSVLAVTGIASPSLMEAELKRRGNQVSLMTFPDHHSFSRKDIGNMAQKLMSLGPDSFIVTTTKDASRLYDLDIDTELRSRIYVLPVGVRFLRDGDAFDRTVKGHVESFGK